MNLYYLFFAVLLTSCKADTSVQKYFRYNGPGVISGTIINSLTARSGIKCASTCSLTGTSCDASRYHEATKTCELLSGHPNGDVQWINHPDWKIYTSQPISCGPGWYEYGSSCYLVVTTGTTWQVARENCSAIGAHLAVITDASENAFLVDLLNNTLNMESDIFWIGANDADVEGTFVWETMEPFTFTAYAPSQPDSSPNFNCMGMRPINGWYTDETQSYSSFLKSQQATGVTDLTNRQQSEGQGE
ncbi:secretory phospholipase A2 receptor-like [Mya arenaria]|uniref:secretory phospholipase A2 receptor-like n=1 Tax=Mya arenaria TaxID=6604 RepID=UPI0022E288A7|nr:secretory phospholipase A2 receptor-like [Mya arenaria]